MGSVSRRIRNDIRQKVTGSRRPKYGIRLRPPHPGQPTPKVDKDGHQYQCWDEVGACPESWWQRLLRRSR